MASFSTTALRILAVEALAPSAQYAAADPSWPTIMAGRVYDSGAIPFDRSPDAGGPGAGMIHVSVYTDEARGTPRGEAYGRAPQDLVSDLIFELEIPIIDGSGEMGVGPTDASGVALLEAGAGQIRRVLAGGATAAAFRRLAKGFGGVEARWTRHPELSVRLARLTMRLPILLDDDDWSNVVGGLPWPAHAGRAALPAGSYGAAVLDRLAALWVAPADPAPLEEIRFGFGLAARPADLSTAPIAGTVDFD